MILDPQMKRLRFLKMLDLKIRGHGNKEIAREFNLSLKTVERTLTWGKRADLITQEEDHILETLLPLARSAIKGALEAGDAKVALDIYKGTGILSKNKAKAPPGAADPQAELARHIAQKRAAAQLLEDTVDGELVQHQLTDGEPASVAESGGTAVPGRVEEDFATQSASAGESHRSADGAPDVEHAG